MAKITKTRFLSASGEKGIRSSAAIYGLTFILTLVLFFAFGTNNDTLNDDGINYIYAAHALADGDLEQAKTYRPEVLFYHQITLIASLTGLDLHPSAKLLSLFWQIMLAAAFMAIIRRFDDSTQSQIIALAVFFSMSSINHLRPDIIRGFGFWALQLWAIWAGLRFIQSKLWRFAVLWLGLSSLAIVYRIESIAYLLLVPLFTLLAISFTGQLSSNKLLKMSSLLVIFSGAIWLFLWPEHKQLPSGTPLLAQLQPELEAFKRATINFDQLKTDISAVMPTQWAQRSVNDLLIGGFIFHLLVILLKTTNTPLIALSLYRGHIKRPFLRSPQHTLLANYILIGILIGLMSVYNKYFLSARYIMLTAILICVPITFVLSQSYTRFMASRQVSARAWRSALFILPLLACLYPLSRQNDDKLYIREAGEWVKTQLKNEQMIYFNTQKVAFYSADYTNVSFKKQYNNVQDLIHEGYHYAVLYEVKGEQQPLPRSLQKHRLKTFQNSRGRSVSIYKLPAPDS
jgi:hypothetical protein